MNNVFCKRILVLLSALLLTIVLSSTVIHAADNKYIGGLLDGQPLKYGSELGKPLSAPVTTVTDGNKGTSQSLSQLYHILWYDFDQPQEISAVITNASSLSLVNMEFYDGNSNLLLSYTPKVNDGVEILPQVVKNVKRVVLKTSNSNYIMEWNVFTTPLTAPLPTTVNRVYNGDHNVVLYWADTGASSYIVKRSTVVGGPYSVIEKDLKNLTYNDSTVSNGTTYYYVVSAVNQFGESINSTQIEAIPSATKYTGGFLDGKVLNIGGTLGKPVNTNTTVTDNNKNTSQSLTSTYNLLWYDFAQSKDIDSAIVNTTNVALITMQFYDENNNLLLSYTPKVNDTMEMLPQTVKNVKRVVLKDSTPNSEYVLEWNVFGKEGGANIPTTPENPGNDGGSNDSGNSGERALLTILLNTGIEKEYDLSMAEVEAFINWYEQRATGTGTITFAIDKHNNNKGPFNSRKDYVIYDKIITFEVNSYSN